MAEEKGGGDAGETGRVDRWFQGVLNYVGKTVSTFVAFLYFILTIGMLIGWVVTFRAPEAMPLLAMLPAAIGLLAYYNRVFATIAFVGFLVLFVFL